MSIAARHGLTFAVRAAALGALVAATAGLAPRPGSAGAALDEPIRASWTRLPLGEWAERISGMTGVPLVVDRRIDRTLPITLDGDGLPLAEVLDRVATTATAEVEVLASSLRLVPPAEMGRAAAAERDRTGALAALPAEEGRRLAATAEWTWPAGSPPRQLVSELAAAAGLKLAGLEAIPHDHLPAAHLLPLSVAERIDLVLAQFDLRAEWKPGGGTITPLPRPPTRTAPASLGRPSPLRRRPRSSAAEERYSLRLEAPLDQALAAVARRFELQPRIDAAGLTARGISPAEVVRVHVEQVERDALLDAIVAPLGLSWAIEGDTLRVFAPAAPDVAE